MHKILPGDLSPSFFYLLNFYRSSKNSKSLLVFDGKGPEIFQVNCTENVYLVSAL